jgi:hypothetical protein
MLQDVFGLIELSDDIGCRGLLVHAESLLQSSRTVTFLVGQCWPLPG